MVGAGRWVQLDGWCWSLSTAWWSVEFGRSISPVMTVRWVNRGCVDRVADSYCGSYVSQVLQWLEQSVTASRYVDCVVPCRSVEFGRSTSSVMTICWINRGGCRPGFWLVQRVVREPVVAVVGQSVTVRDALTRRQRPLVVLKRTFEHTYVGGRKAGLPREVGPTP